jgi:cation transport protein ChaC
MFDTVLDQWGGTSDLWIFGYASLIWRPEFEFAEQRRASVYGYHRALKMWSRVNRGSPECPGLVFALLSGGSCKGMAFRLAQADVAATLPLLWAREMPTGVYDPKWLRCRTAGGPVRALAFTLSRHSPNYTGALPDEVYAQIFAQAKGRYGFTRDYAQLTHDTLASLGMPDAALARLLRLGAARPESVLKVCAADAKLGG